MRVTHPRPHRWTKAEYHQMADLGWFDEQRIELIDGQIVDFPVPSPKCCVGIALATEALLSAFGPDYWIRNQAPLDLGTVSEPQPDLALVPGDPRDYDEHPTTALL